MQRPTQIVTVTQTGPVSNWHVYLADGRRFTLLRKDEKFRRANGMFCKAILLVHFDHILREIKHDRDSVTFDDKGFFSRYLPEDY